MPDTDTTVEASDTDALIKQWRASEKRVEQVAAEIAVGQLGRWDELPSRQR